MLFYAVKLFISASLIVAVTEVAKRSSLWGGILASLPLVSLLSFIWLYIETKDTSKIAGLSWSIFWLVLPSLTLFVALPILLKRQMAFPLALIISVLLMVAAYLATAAVLRRFGISI